DEVIRAGGGEEFAIRGEIDAENGVAMRGGDFAHEGGIGGAPELDLAAAGGDAAAGGEELAIGGEVEREDAVGERRFFIARADVARELPGGDGAPEDGAIALGGGKEALAGAGERAEVAELARISLEACAGFRAPG